MAFGQTKVVKRKSGTTGFSNPELPLREGTVTVRVLLSEGGSEVSYVRYWMIVNIGGEKQNRPVTVAQDMPSLRRTPIYKYFEDLRDTPQERKPQLRRVVNVWNTTLVKKTPNGDVYYPDASGSYPATSRSGEDLGTISPEPDNEVRLLNMGPTLFEHLTNLHQTVRNNTTHQVMDITEFDINITTRGSGRETTRFVIPGLNQNPLPADTKINRYLIEKMYLPVSFEGQAAILDGEDYNEVMEREGLRVGYPRENPE